MKGAVSPQLIPVVWGNQGCFRNLQEEMLCRESVLCPLLDGEASWMGPEVTGGKVKEQSGEMGQGQNAAAACGKAVGRAGLCCGGKWSVQTLLAFTEC